MAKVFIHCSHTKEGKKGSGVSCSAVTRRPPIRPGSGVSCSFFSDKETSHRPEGPLENIAWFRSPQAGPSSG